MYYLKKNAIESLTLPPPLYFPVFCEHNALYRFSPQAVPRSFQATIDKITNIKDVYVYFGEFVIFVNENQWRYHNRGEDFTLVTFDSTDYEEKYDYLVDNKMP